MAEDAALGGRRCYNRRATLLATMTGHATTTVAALPSGMLLAVLLRRDGMLPSVCGAPTISVLWCYNERVVVMPTGIDMVPALLP
jgi:hypothetical protein